MFKFNEKAKIVFSGLIALGFLPEEGDFEITEKLLYEYKRLYYLDWPNFIDVDPWNTRKYAGSSLLDLKRSRNIKVSGKNAPGFLYFIGNPAWENDLKVGISSDYKKRLAAYQTYSPRRDYFIHGWEFVLSKKAAEDLILSEFQIDADLGEWVSFGKHEKLIKFIRTHSSARHIELSKRIYKKQVYQVGDSVLFKRDKYPQQKGKIVRFLTNDRIMIDCPRLTGKLTRNKSLILHLSECLRTANR